VLWLLYIINVYIHWLVSDVRPSECVVLSTCAVTGASQYSSHQLDIRGRFFLLPGIVEFTVQESQSQNANEWAQCCCEA